MKKQRTNSGPVMASTCSVSAREIEIDPFAAFALAEALRQPPPARGTFFYAGKTAMGTFTQRVYEAVYGLTFTDQQAFLRYFCDTGAFLDDLSATPVDHLSRAQRHRILRASIQDFTMRLQAYYPERVICILRSIAPYVQQAISQAGLSVPLEVLPFPGCGWQRAYMHGLTYILRAHTRRDSGTTQESSQLPVC